MNQKIREAGKQVVGVPLAQLHSHRPASHPGLPGQVSPDEMIPVIVPKIDEGMLQQLGQGVTGGQLVSWTGWAVGSAGQDRAVGEPHRGLDRAGTGDQVLGDVAGVDAQQRPVEIPGRHRDAGLVELP